PAAGVVPRRLRAGDFLATPSGPGVVSSILSDGSALAQLIGPSRPSVQVPPNRQRTILRTDHNLGVRRPTPVLAVGARVLAKWDARSWWVGRIKSRVGEALWIHFDDGSLKWIPADLAVPLATLKPGAQVYGVNAMEGQIIPATLLSLGDHDATIRFFDGRVGHAPLAKLLAPLDQVGLDFGDPCTNAPKPTTDVRPAAQILRRKLSSTLQFYSESSSRRQLQTSASHLELGFCYYLPQDRRPRSDWQAITRALAAQVKGFLERELGRFTRVTLRIHPVPVQSAYTLAWHKANLREKHAWHYWVPTASCVNAVFGDGVKAGRHRVVVVLPDAPGISSDSSGVERGMGFVRMKGEWFARISASGVQPSRFSMSTSFSQWIPDYLSTTIAHEVLHTIGLPHTDGDPFEVMNIGPWYPITRKQVHIAAIHKMILRSPFRGSLSLAQGVAKYLVDPAASYLRVIRETRRADTRLRLLYALGPGFFRLTETFRCFAPGSRGRRGARTFTGERILCRAYLASFAQFLIERAGVAKLLTLSHTADVDVVRAAASLLQLTPATLERHWHAWLRKKGAGW
ncbi:MAG: hypothetical protein KC609_00385, partial [Myxococcales bacterium]|nr:hypothetical protein [Myxococcales bacterium]